MEFLWTSGTWDGEISFTITDPGGGTVYSGGAPGAGPFAVDLFNDPSCGVVGCVASLPQTESFGTGSLPANWSISQTTGDGWRFTGTPGYNAYNNGRPNTPWIDFSSTDAGVILESPLWCSGSALQVTLSFDYWSSDGSSTYSPYNIMYVEQFDGSSWSVVDSYQEDNAGWVTKTVTLNAYTHGDGTNVIKFRFRGESGGSGADYYGDLLIDEVSCQALVPCSGSPTTATISASTNSSCSGDVVTITASGYDTDQGVAYQWLANGSPISGETSATLDVSPTSTTSYAFRSTCVFREELRPMDEIVSMTTCYSAPASGNNSILACSGNVYDAVVQPEITE